MPPSAPHHPNNAHCAESLGAAGHHPGKYQICSSHSTVMRSGGTLNFRKLISTQKKLGASAGAQIHHEMVSGQRWDRTNFERLLTLSSKLLGRVKNIVLFKLGGA